MMMYMDVPAPQIGYAIEAPSKPGEDEWHAVLPDLALPSAASTATDVRKLIDDFQRRIFATAT